jgi:2'-5' RNA ligase
LRCFLAVPLSEPAIGAAQRLLGELRERVPATRWARPESLHITVHFFGEVEEGAALHGVELVAPAARGTQDFDVDVDRLGSFPAHGAPRVLWLGPAGDIAPLRSLALQCRAVLGEGGFEVESRPYNAHCTLGRPRSPWTQEARSAWAAAVAERRTPMRFTATRLVLYESRAAAGGAIYTERAELPFASGSRVEMP